MDYRIPFSGRAHSYNNEELNLILEIAKSASPLTQGENLRKFQEKFRKYSNSRYSFAVSNATAALELTAQLCQFSPGDEVIIPGHTYTASAYPFLKKGAKIVWADIDKETRVISVESFKKSISNKTKAVVVVHLYGYGADIEEIIKIARERKILVIEDAAQALGVRVNKKMVGTYGDFGIFSFHSHKNISTLGEGGMLTLKEKKFADIIPMLRHNGHIDFNFKRENYWIPAMGNVDIPELNGEKIWPNNYCLGEVECALGEKLLDRIDEQNLLKRGRGLNFIDELKNFENIIFHRVENDRHNYHLLVARLKRDRDKFIEMMSISGIQCAVQYYPLYRYDLYKKVGQGESDCPNTDDFFDNMVSFPFQHSLSDKDFHWMIKQTKLCLQKLND